VIVGSNKKLEAEVKHPQAVSYPQPQLINLSLFGVNEEKGSEEGLVPHGYGHEESQAVHRGELVVAAATLALLGFLDHPLPAAGKVLFLLFVIHTQQICPLFVFILLVHFPHSAHCSS